MRMIRLLYVEAGGEGGRKKSIGRLDASEGGEDFLLDVVSAECTISLPPSFSISLQHKHTHTYHLLLNAHMVLHLSI